VTLPKALVRKPCNHKNPARVGVYQYADGGLGQAIHWCHRCGAVNWSGDWSYPKRAWVRAPHKKGKR
jgi:hypothetical protein